MQVLVAVVSLKELTKDQVGQHTVKQYTRYLTFGAAVVQSILPPPSPPVRHRAGDALLPHRRSNLHHGRGDRGVAGGRDDHYGLGRVVRDDYHVGVRCVPSALQYYWSAPRCRSRRSRWCLAAVVLIAGSVLVQTGTCKVPLLYFQGPSIPVSQGCSSGCR